MYTAAALLQSIVVHDCTLMLKTSKSTLTQYSTDQLLLILAEHVSIETPLKYGVARFIAMSVTATSH